jgi:hypothetical protein
MVVEAMTRHTASDRVRPVSVTQPVSQHGRQSGRQCAPVDLGSCQTRGDSMDTQLLVICGLTFVIHVIATLAYAVRIAGVRTRRIAVSFSLFGIIALVSRTANSFQGPFIAKRVELDIAHHTEHGRCISNSHVPALFQSCRRSFSSESLDPSLATPYLQSRRRQLHSAWSAAAFATQRHATGNWRRRLLESYRTERYRDGDLDSRRFRIALCWIPEARFASYVRESVYRQLSMALRPWYWRSSSIRKFQ